MKNLIQSLPGNSRSSLDYSPGLPARWVILHCCCEFVAELCKLGCCGHALNCGSGCLSRCACGYLFLNPWLSLFHQAVVWWVLCRMLVSSLLQHLQVVHASFDNGILTPVGFSNDGLSSGWRYGSPSASSLVFR